MVLTVKEDVGILSFYKFL